MDHHRVKRIPSTAAGETARQKNDRGFQPLRFVHGQYLHRVTVALEALHIAAIHGLCATRHEGFQSPDDLFDACTSAGLCEQ